MDLAAFPVVIAVADSGSLSEAARRLSRSQSSVSRMVARFERDLGVELFSRRGPRLKLNAAGARFLPHARDVARAYEEALAFIDTRRCVSTVRAPC
jgi:LysR family transcriptional activator of glutamate synthase operon